MQEQRTTCLELSGSSLSVKRGRCLPAQHTQNQIKHEKGAEDDKTDKVHPWKLKAHSVIHLEEDTPPQRKERSGKREGKTEKCTVKLSEKRSRRKRQLLVYINK